MSNVIQTGPSVCCHNFHSDQLGGQIGLLPYSASYKGELNRIGLTGVMVRHRPV